MPEAEKSLVHVFEVEIELVEQARELGLDRVADYAQQGEDFDVVEANIAEEELDCPKPAFAKAEPDLWDEVAHPAHLQLDLEDRLQQVLQHCETADVVESVLEEAGPEVVLLCESVKDGENSTRMLQLL